MGYTVRLIAFAALLAIAIPVEADEPDPWRAADAVLRAHAAQDVDALRQLASRDEPDPWLVADDLCRRGHFNAALAFAKAVPRHAVRGLPDYVASRRDGPSDERARKAYARVLTLEDPEAVLEAATSVPHQPVVVSVLLADARGWALRRLQRHRESAADYLNAGEAAEGLGWLTKAVAAYGSAGTSARAAGDHATAVQAWRAMHEAARAAGRATDVASALLSLGVGQRALGNDDAAMESYDRALALYRDIGDAVGAGWALHNRGNVLLARSELDAALEAFRDSQQAFAEAEARRGLASALASEGLVLTRQGRAEAAREALERALRIRVATGDTVAAARTLHHLAHMHIERREDLEALELLRTSLGYHRRPEVLTDAGHLLWRLGHYAEALARLDEAMPLWGGDRGGRAKTLNLVGLVQERLGRYEEALRCFRSSLDVKRELGMLESAAKTLNNIGMVFVQLGREAEALESYGAALAQWRSSGNDEGAAVTLYNVGVLQHRLGDDASAVQTLEEALDVRQRLGDELGVARTLIAIGGVLASQGREEGARRLFAKARRILDEVPDGYLCAHLAWASARLELGAGRAEKAMEASRTGIEAVAHLVRALSSDERASGRDVFAGLFETGLEAARRLGDTDRVLYFLEWARASALRESLGSREALEAATLPPALRRALAAARSRARRALDAIASARAADDLASARAARRDWEVARADIDAAGARIQREARLIASVTLTPPHDLAEVRTHLAPSDALVLYGYTDEDVLALVVRPEGARTVAVAPSEAVDGAVDAFLDWLRSARGRSHPPPLPADLVARLREALVRPLELPGSVRRVLISPAGRLAYVPFALLLPEREIAYVPSATTYGLLVGDGAKHGRRILALGDPAYGPSVAGGIRYQGGPGGSWRRLPASRVEAEAVGDLALLGTDATRRALRAALGKSERYRAVHLACHTWIDPEHPMLSALVLAPDGQDDGCLAALDVVRMRMPTDLVVLSACQSAQGRVYRTEGIVGLTQAFMFAGAPRVLCSLWDVDDEATRALMVKFYELWNPGAEDGSTPSGGMPAAAALRAAQAHIRADPRWEHPLYWAAWVLWGLPS